MKNLFEIQVPKYLLWVLVIVIFVGFIFAKRGCRHKELFKPKEVEKSITRYEDSLKRNYEDQIRQKSDSINQIVFVIGMYEDSIAKLNKKIEKNKIEVENIRISYNHILKSIDTISNDSVTNFYIDRYVFEKNTEQIITTKLSLPNNILKFGMRDIITGDEYRKFYNYAQSDIATLALAMNFKDSIIHSENVEIKLKEGVIFDYKNKFDLSNQDNDILKKKYTYLKTNDRIKMGVCGAIIAGTMYLLIKK